VVLASACGLRAFLPLWVLGLMARAGVVHLSGRAVWLSHDFALIALGVATLVEIAADKIPVVDHALDAVGMVVRPMAGWFASYALFHDWPTPWGQGAALVLAFVALGVQLAKAKLRLGTTALTLGHANPVVSLLEDATALVLAWMALVVPLAALALLVALGVAIRRRTRTA
jgi:hypothetical protein